MEGICVGGPVVIFLVSLSYSLSNDMILFIPIPVYQFPFPYRGLLFELYLSLTTLYFILICFFLVLAIFFFLKRGRQVIYFQWFFFLYSFVFNFDQNRI